MPLERCGTKSSILEVHTPLFGGYCSMYRDVYQNFRNIVDRLASISLNYCSCLSGLVEWPFSNQMSSRKRDISGEVTKAIEAGASDL